MVTLIFELSVQMEEIEEICVILPISAVQAGIAIYICFVQSRNLRNQLLLIAQ